MSSIFLCQTGKGKSSSYDDYYTTEDYYYEDDDVDVEDESPEEPSGKGRGSSKTGHKYPVVHPASPKSTKEAKGKVSSPCSNVNSSFGRNI